MNALLALPDLQPERLFVQSGDVRLAVHCWGAPDNDKPTLLMVHGYPDNHETWLPLIRQLAGRYRIVAYDVRGAGASDKPRWSRDYHLQRLSEDLQAVIRATSPDRPVHLLAHDWGSIQTWESVTDPQCRPLIASYTSISGPCLDHVGFWMREHLRQRSPKALKAVFGQLLHSWYIAFFHTPVVPELLWSAGLARLWPQFLKHAEGVRHPAGQPDPGQRRPARGQAVPRQLHPQPVPSAQAPHRSAGATDRTDPRPLRRRPAVPAPQPVGATPVAARGERRPLATAGRAGANWPAGSASSSTPRKPASRRRPCNAPRSGPTRAR
ncbi:short chain dehydrogenase [Pseudomonas aeruginosa]|nr:short chain dehydrogenase [Pseudomonas aeruginosa]